VYFRQSILESTFQTIHIRQCGTHFRYYVSASKYHILHIIHYASASTDQTLHIRPQTSDLRHQTSKMQYRYHFRLLTRSNQVMGGQPGRGKAELGKRVSKSKKSFPTGSGHVSFSGGLGKKTNARDWSRVETGMQIETRNHAKRWNNTEPAKREGAVQYGSYGCRMSCVTAAVRGPAHFSLVTFHFFFFFFFCLPPVSPSAAVDPSCPGLHVRLAV
jgi:hypothetical protein